MERQSTLNRNNTYLPKEYFKVIAIAANKDKAELSAQWLTNSKTPVRGVYGCSYNRSQMIVFFRYPGLIDKGATTVAVEALIVFVDSEEEFEIVKPELAKYGQIPIRVLTSQQDYTHLAKEINATWIQKEEKSEDLKDELDSLDKEELKRIKKQFLTYDKDQSGSIDSNEMKEIAAALGEDPNTEEFKQAMLALDFNGDGIISFTEFVAWWKIGRQNTLTLPKIYQLNVNAQKLLNNFIDYSKFTSDIKALGSKGNEKNKQRIYFRSPGMFQLKTFIEMGLAVGGPQRTSMAIDFLKQFTTNTTIAKNNWISILLTLDPKQKSINATKAKALLEEFKDNILKWGEENGNPVLISFVKNLMLFETSSTDKAVILVSRIKLDIEELVKDALQQILAIISSLSEKNESFWLSLKAHSNCDLYESLYNKTTVGDFLKTCEVMFEGSGFRNRLKTLLNNLKGGYQKDLSLLKLLLLPYDLNLDLDGDLNDLVDEKSKSILNIPLEKIGFILGFLKENLSSELLSICNNIEIGLNAFDIFARLKFYSKSVFSQQYNVSGDI